MPEAVHIHTRIDSETLTLPALRPFVGKAVEIIVREEVVAPKRPNVDLLEKLAKEIDFDEETEKAFWELRRISTV